MYLYLICDIDFLNWCAAKIFKVFVSDPWNIFGAYRVQSDLQDVSLEENTII